jgi:hypothetical protein
MASAPTAALKLLHYKRHKRFHTRAKTEPDGYKLTNVECRSWALYHLTKHKMKGHQHLELDCSVRLSVGSDCIMYYNANYPNEDLNRP